MKPFATMHATLTLPSPMGSECPLLGPNLTAVAQVSEALVPRR
ncbi:MAG: hypothetical protein ACRD2I_18605 [Vicinamibacterales bacterium]